MQIGPCLGLLGLQALGKFLGQEAIQCSPDPRAGSAPCMCQPSCPPPHAAWAHPQRSVPVCGAPALSGLPLGFGREWRANQKQPPPSAKGRVVGMGPAPPDSPGWPAGARPPRRGYRGQEGAQARAWLRARRRGSGRGHEGSWPPAVRKALTAPRMNSPITGRTPETFLLGRPRPRVIHHLPQVSTAAGCVPSSLPTPLAEQKAQAGPGGSAHVSCSTPSERLRLVENLSSRRPRGAQAPEPPRTVVLGSASGAGAGAGGWGGGFPADA